MKYILFYVFALNLCFLSLNAQVTRVDHYNIIDNKVFTFSKQKPDAPFDTITTFVNTNFQTQEDRARAYYTWIALNISYDVEHMKVLDLMQLFSVSGETSSNQKGLEVIKNKKAVCEGYSNLMVDLCTASSIPCFMVCGNTKTPNGDIPQILHAWNVLRIDSAWVMLDITWSSGYVDYSGNYVKRFSNLYFLPKPKKFIKDHFPLDPMWQLLKNPFTKKDFENDSLTVSHEPVFNFVDSIRAYRAQPIKQRQYLDFLHYYKADPDNKKHAQNLDVFNNNLVADELNRGVAYQSDFLDLNKKRLAKKPTIADCNKAKEMLDSISSCNNRAQAILSKIQAQTPEYKTVFSNMQFSIISNRNIIKSNYEYLVRLRKTIPKKK
jgi:hypothetical protein